MTSEQADDQARSHSGRLLLRMPKTLHAELAARSDADGVSLNQYIVSALARAVSGDELPGPATEQERRDRSLRTALVVNAVVVGLAAVTAIVLLIVALR
jgi:multisubunit Na+/H+ antiporter MnhC subunit